VPGELGHSCVDLDSEYPTPGSLERTSRDAGAGADIENVGTGTGSDYPVDKGLGVVRPGPIVPLRVGTERLRCLSGKMRCWREVIRHKPGSYRAAYPDTRQIGAPMIVDVVCILVIRGIEVAVYLVSTRLMGE
jgi:hypothetical protein